MHLLPHFCFQLRSLPSAVLLETGLAGLTFPSIKMVRFFHGHFDNLSPYSVLLPAMLWTHTLSIASDVLTVSKARPCCRHFFFKSPPPPPFLKAPSLVRSIAGFDGLTSRSPEPNHPHNARDFTVPTVRFNEIGRFFFPSQPLHGGSGFPQPAGRCIQPCSAGQQSYVSFSFVLVYFSRLPKRRSKYSHGGIHVIE